MIGKYRNEWKYYLSAADFQIIQNRIGKFLNVDENANYSKSYNIHSLYFDDYSNTCLYENEAGINKRHKWRIRYYDDLSDIFLEKKEKINNLCKKRSCKISKEQYSCLINGECEKIIYDENNELIKEFCIEIMTKLYKPKVIISYERIAYVDPITNIRITYDKNISASNEISKFLSNDYIRFQILPINKNILEIKFDDILPSHIKKAVQIKTLNKITFSKYYLGREKVEKI